MLDVSLVFFLSIVLLREEAMGRRTPDEQKRLQRCVRGAELPGKRLRSPFSCDGVWSSS